MRRRGWRFFCASGWRGLRREDLCCAAIGVGWVLGLQWNFLRSNRVRAKGKCPDGCGMNGYAAQQFSRNGAALVAHIQAGEGPVVVLQHGLCGDARQPAELFPGGQGYRHAVLDCRGHGDSVVGDLGGLTLADFADDVAALAEGLRPVAIGGVSMGAAIALRLAVLRPDLVRALILVRPAWGVGQAPAHLAANVQVGRMIAAGLGVAEFDAGETAQRLAVQAPDNLVALRGFFGREPLAVTAALLTRISEDGIGVSRRDLAGLRLPVLLLATEEDALHPLDLAQDLAAMIPGARLVEVVPKGRDRAGHFAAVQVQILSFLKGLT